MNYRTFLTSMIVAGSTLTPLFAADPIFTPTVIPPGANPLTIAQPRDEWRQKVQKLFDQTQGKQFDLVFDGDSLTEGWIWKDRGQDIWNARYQKLNGAVFGIAGDQTQNVLWRLHQGELAGMHPKLIVLMIGSNNLTIGNFSPEDTAAGVKELLSEYTKECPDAKLLLLAVLPKSLHAKDPIRAKITALNALIAGMADGKQITYLDFTDKFVRPDGELATDLYVADLTHPSAKGYQIWADAIQPTIEQYFPPSTTANP